MILRSDVAEDIRALAALAGVSITDAVAQVVKAQLAIERVKASVKLSKRHSQAERALSELRRLPVVGPELPTATFTTRRGCRSENRRRRLGVTGDFAQ
jgi:hypothetical protein